MVSEAQTYDIDIDDSALAQSEFIRFSLSLQNGKSEDGKSKVTLYNLDPRRIIHFDIYKHDYPKSIQTFKDALMAAMKEDELLDDSTVANLITCFDNVCKILKEDKDSGFFHRSVNSSRNGEGKTKKILTIPQAARCIIDGQYIQTQGIVTTVFKLRKLVEKGVFRCLNCRELNESLMPRLGGDNNDRPHLFKLPREPKKCVNCEEDYFESCFPYINAVVIELRDPDTFSDIDSLYAVLFDNETNAIHSRIAEIATLTGHIHILEQPTTHRSINYLYVDSIKYESSQREVILTALDEKAVFRFTKLKNHQNMLDVLANMFATEVIGEIEAKKSIILAAASTGLNRKKKKINVGLVGSPGLAKSILLRNAVKIVPGSRFESAQSSTGKGLTAAVTSKEGEGMILTTGAIPAAKGAMAAINEIGRTAPDDQKYLLDVMEEQEFTINKADIHAKVLAPVSIIASCNPVTGEFEKDVSGEDIIDLNAFPAIIPLKDRFDLLIPIKSVNKNDDKKNKEYAITRLSTDAKKNKKIPPNYEEYLMKHIELSKRFDPDLSDEAIDMISNYYVEITKKSDHGSRRPLETIRAISKLIAKLNLKNTVDANDVREMMLFYSEVSSVAGKMLNLATSPVDAACKAFIEVLHTTGQPATTAQLYHSVCDQAKNSHIKEYLGDEPKIERNWKLRAIIDKILQNSHVKLVQDRPKTLRWLDPDNGGDDNNNNGNGCLSRQASDVSDVSDAASSPENKKNSQGSILNQENKSQEENNRTLKKNGTTPLSDTSDTSDTSDREKISHNTIKEESSNYSCYHCYDFHTNSEGEYKGHMGSEHIKGTNDVNHPCFPCKADIERLGLKAQGKSWEI